MTHKHDRRMRSSAEERKMPAVTVDELSERELSVVRRIAQDKTYEEIAGELGLGLETVRTHARRLRGKLQLNKSGIAAWAVRKGIV